MLPGLIDAHVHFFFDCSADPVRAFLASDDDTRLQTAASNAAVGLAAGITTMRDLGAPRNLMEYFFRQVQRGEVKGPHIISSGAPLTRQGGHCHFFGGEVTTAQDVQRTVEQHIASGCQCVKIMASGGGMTAGTRPSEADFPLELMRLAREVAHAHGVPITAHCHATESIRRSIDAGLDSIEHVSFLEPDGRPRFDEDLAIRLRDAGVAVCPNVANGLRAANVFRTFGTYHEGDPTVIERLEARRGFTKEFHRLGLTILGGSDCGTNDTPFDVLIDEVQAFKSVGFTNAEALRSVTSECAHNLWLPRTGEVKVGYDADLIFLDTNPLDDLAALRQLAIVMKSGEVVHDFRSGLRPNT
jgi:imidazolonepropionase-like amidohydrolase